MYRSASLDMPSDSVAMRPPGRPLSRAAAPVLDKSSRPTENGSVFGDPKNVHSLKSSDKVVNPAEPIKTNDAESLKRKAKANGVDMRQPEKKIRLLEIFSEVVKLLVGTHRKIFLVHKDMICAASPFFEAGFKPQWQKSGECIMELPEDDPTYFAPLLYWVYNNKVVHVHETMTVEALSRVYCLAEKYQMPRLQNDLIDAMVYEVVARNQYICISGLNEIFRNSLPGSKLRLLAVNCTLTNWRSFDLKRWKQTSLNTDLVFEILLAINKDPRAVLKRDFLGFKTSAL
ncbi:hypothetical protein EYC84_011473 [Monilinia fructicola]|uniref:BTB domain-containing protein n=1 Tax=Monilinia fructicola TaxID=38448 RepID=A0A5M9J8E8_MONFR|nr:hypothetical protein EYC84_011473 [Monilinia fructicola]